MATLSFRRAIVEDADAISDLVNSAYRGESSKQGWTTEADLLDGLRTTVQEIQQIISCHDSFLLVCHRGARLAGSVHVERLGMQAYFGMFVVRPDMQGAGIGKHLLDEAETWARKAWKICTFTMVVITSRQELIEFYERRGYRRTGELSEFPANPTLWMPKVSGLKLERMEKLTKIKSFC